MTISTDHCCDQQRSAEWGGVVGQGQLHRTLACQSCISFPMCRLFNYRQSLQPAGRSVEGVSLPGRSRKPQSRSTSSNNMLMVHAQRPKRRAVSQDFQIWQKNFGTYPLGRAACQRQRATTRASLPTHLDLGSRESEGIEEGARPKAQIAASIRSGQPAVLCDWTNCSAPHCGKTNNSPPVSGAQPANVVCCAA